MAAQSIPLGTADRLTQLYSHPNKPGDRRTPLAKTILHWFNQTLERDGLSPLGAKAKVRTAGDDHFLDLEGPDPLAADFRRYADRLLRMLENGWVALTGAVEKVKADGKWDPENVGWRFFLPHGLAMSRQRSVQFFHYPPIRLLDTMQDYLNDPVPVRCAELLRANGVCDDPEAWLYETVMDATPIAAPDDQGSKKGPDGKPLHLIPIEYFHDYQRAQTALLLNDSPVNPAGYTIPSVVYGGEPRKTFNELYGTQLGVNTAAVAEVVTGKKTPVIGANHPYKFFAQAQIYTPKDKTDKTRKSDVGAGKIVPQNCAAAVQLMTQDLIVAAWQHRMADDPTQDVQAVLRDCTAYWQHPHRAAEVCALVQHQGSLSYPDPQSLNFTFKLTREQAADRCRKHGNDACACQIRKA